MKFTNPGGEDFSKQITNMGSVPAHNKNGLQPKITKIQMMNLCLDEIHKILKNEKVNMLVDLVNLVVYDMDVVPIFSFREIALQMENDNRFSYIRCKFAV